MDYYQKKLAEMAKVHLNEKQKLIVDGLPYKGIESDNSACGCFLGHDDRGFCVFLTDHMFQDEDGIDIYGAWVIRTGETLYVAP